MSSVAIVQARMGSARFPGKVMRPVCGVPLIGLLMKRLSRARLIDKIVLATSNDPRNQPLANYVRGLGYEVHLGAEYDVLDRYYQVAKITNAQIIVRVTGDCPLVDPTLVDAVVTELHQTKNDYVCNGVPPTYPDGLDAEAFTFAALERAWREATQRREREHVTPFIREAGCFKWTTICHDEDLSSERWTVDEPDDLQVIERVFEYFDPKQDFSWRDVLSLRTRHPEFFRCNRHLKRNEGENLGAGQKLWKRAKRVIPGGNMFLSKRAELALPERWPAYFSRAKGCKVWDLDGREYVDMSLMGVGTNILGYGHPEVDSAVRRTIDAGNVSSLNCPEEVYLAERLIELHPWAEMVRLARTGGEANAIAIRIARAASARAKVAVCGYHGWQDWYLSANLGDAQRLADYFLPDIEPKGIPENLQGTVLPFHYNQFDELERLVNREPDVGVIMMEVSRNEAPADDFLQKIRKLATERSLVLIFDECTSGFRETFGGLHKKYGVEPDMAVFGKALGNGYAIAAIIGRREVMEAAQHTFISSTFWSERVGPTAALATINVMERIQPWEQITNTGTAIRRGWESLAHRYDLELSIEGLSALPTFKIKSPNALAYKTLIAQEMLAKGYLAANSVYVCIAHETSIIDRYFETIEPVFSLIQECEHGRDVMTLLKGPVCQAGFRSA